MFIEGHLIYHVKMKKYAFTLLIILLTYSVLFAQKYDNPIAGKVTHPELKIVSIEITESNTIVSLTVTNKRDQGGWFCADEHIYLKNSKGSEVYELIRSENIPTCPEQFKFSYVGQELHFLLYFPPISEKIKFLDLIEDCSNACFAFHGIILDNEHNAKIRSFEQGYELYQNQQYQEAIPSFKKVLSGDHLIDSHIYGLAYYYIILIYNEIGDVDNMNSWYQQLLNSNLKERTTVIKELEKYGIKKGS